jgi:competence protein ComFA
LVYAVCGSGKTEISYGIIAYAMSRGLHVGFALPRRDVCIELFFRLKSAFPHNRIIAVYGQHTSRLEADCVILTTHQLYRYPNYFDLLVMDEIDAFPFKGNEVLISLFKRSLRGHCVMMSATPSEEIKAEFRKPHHQILELHTRFHKHPIPVPKNVIRLGPLKYAFLIKKLREYRAKRETLFYFRSLRLPLRKAYFKYFLFCSEWELCFEPAGTPKRNHPGLPRKEIFLFGHDRGLRAWRNDPRHPSHHLRSRPQNL